MLGSFRIGNTVTVTVDLTDADGAPIAPQALRGRARHENGVVELALSFGPVTAGRAAATFTPDRPGTWRVRVETDEPDSAVEDTVIVSPSTFPDPS